MTAILDFVNDINFVSIIFEGYYTNIYRCKNKNH